MSPVPKKCRLEKSNELTAASNNDPNSGIIRFEVDKVSTLDIKARFSPEVEVGGVPWRLSVANENNARFGLFLHSMDHQSTQWSIGVNAEYIILNSEHKNCKSSSRMTSMNFHHGNAGWGVKFIWDELIDQTKGFIKDDKLVVEIRLSIISMKGIWMEKRFDLSSTSESSRSDVGLIKEGKLVLVNKENLFAVGRTGNTKTAEENSTGFILFEIRVTDLGICTIHSPEIEVHGTPWTLGLRKMMNSPYLEVYLYPFKSESNIWSINTCVNITLLGAHNVVNNFQKTFTHSDMGMGYRNFILWKDLISEEKGFVKDGKITIQARFTLSNIVGIRTISPIDFTDPNEPRHDVALVIQGQKVYAGKQILAFHSPFFNAMFYGNHVEKDMKEIELMGVDRTIFIEMLNLIYPSYHKINEFNVECLLKMADYLQIKIVIDKIEEYLVNSNILNTLAKLKIADQYRLVKVQEHCLDLLKTVQDIAELKATEGYKTLSMVAKSALMDKTMKLI